MLNVKVENMKSRNGNYIPNQFLIYTNEGVFFQSYSSIIAHRFQGQVTLDENKWDYSSTTSQYRNMFLNEGIAETRKKIESGVYKLADLNS